MIMEPRRYTIDDYFAAASAREMIGEEETRAVVAEIHSVLAAE